MAASARIAEPPALAPPALATPSATVAARSVADTVRAFAAQPQSYVSCDLPASLRNTDMQPFCHAGP